MKQLFILVLLSSSLISKAQKDTAGNVQRDTSYVFDNPKLDTVQVETLIYKGSFNRVKYTSPGYFILKGKLVTYDNGRTWKPFGTPTVVAALNRKKRPVKPIRL